MKTVLFVVSAALLSGLAHGQQQKTPNQKQTVPRDLYSRAEKSLSPVNGELRIPGLEKQVKVARDNWGVPHILAQNQHDLFFAQGFIAAQDRLFQMELWKRAGQGRLAEVLGKSAVERDRYARLLRYRGDMQAEYNSYAPDTLPILTAFTHGINAFIRYSANTSGLGLPIEFQLAGFKPEPWKPEDCLSRMAAYSLTRNARAELENAQLLSKLGDDKTLQIIKPDPPVSLDPAEGADYTGLIPDLLNGLIGGDARIDFASGAAGSNDWTIAGKLTDSGKPILANDPHRVIAIPSLRYMVHLVAPGWNVIGAGEPALPGVAIGHNEHVAWGITVFYVDQQDLYLEELNPANRLEYKRDGRWEAMRVEKTTINVKGDTPRILTLEFTRHGPVLWQDASHNRALALRWAGSEPGTAGYLASLAVDRAQNWTDFESAMQRWKLPPENFVYADTEGNIGEQSAGLTPIRTWSGLLPRLGNTDKYEWSGFVPFQDLPRTFNPPEGWIATANNRTIPADYKYKVGYHWSTYRISRLRQVLDQLAQQHKIRVQDVEALQNDVYSVPANELIRMLPRHSDGPEKRFLEKLKDWDRLLRSPSDAAALYEFWERRLRSAVLQKISGSAADQISETLDVRATIDYLKNLSNPDQQELLLSTLRDAGHEIEQTAGTDPALWSWGLLHTMTFRHSLDQLPGGKALFDLGPVARPGDDNTVNATGIGNTAWIQTSGASYREIFDLSKWDNSLAINAPGQSANPGSRHYSDLLPLWAAGQYFPLVYSKDAVETNSEDVLTLSPEASGNKE